MILIDRIEYAYSLKDFFTEAAVN